jgi:hypothetical protein
MGPLTVQNLQTAKSHAQLQFQWVRPYKYTTNVAVWQRSFYLTALHCWSVAKRRGQSPVKKPGRGRPGSN